MKYRITHKTTYAYSETASLSQNELILRPREAIAQKVTETHLEITPEPQYLQHRIDYFGNHVHVFMVQHAHKELSMTAISDVETAAPALPDASRTPAWETVVRQLSDHNDAFALEAYQYVFPGPLTPVNPDVRAYVYPSFPPGKPILAGAVDLIQRIYTEFAYDKAATNVDTSVEQVLAQRKGVCQDFAHLAISCLRSIGLAARYVSGYLETLPPPGKPKLIGADASHAWLSLFVPGVAWVDLDPTNNLITGDKHITLAWGRDYSDVTPVKGVVMGGGAHRLSVNVDVTAFFNLK